MWKVLLVISAVVLAFTAYLSFSNMKEMELKLSQLGEQKGTLEKRLVSLEETNVEVAQLEQSIQTLDDETEALETEKIDLDAKVVEAQSSLKAMEAKLVASQDKLDRAKGTIGDIAKIESLQREMLQIRTQIEEAEIEVTQLEGAVASAQVERDRLEKVAAEMVALRKDQQAGVIRGPFKSTIKHAYNQWGFVVINGGNDQGVVSRAQLNVYRRGQPICKLLVTSVEPGESAADVIPGSLAPGQTIQVGDMVTKAAGANAVAVIPAAASATDAEQPDPAAPAAADPFGGGGGAMDSSNAAPDPFGGGGAMDAGGAAEAPDPFGGGAMDGGDAAPDPFQ
tara:strand:- start:1966 stop:2979 length:1014 start_codon:yes stop_codon:yes gene_type:complete